MKKQDSQSNSGASDIGAYTIAELETGKDRLNVLWNDGGYQATVTHTGVTTAKRVTESSEHIRLNAEKSSALYVRDEDTGDYFTPGGYPCGILPDKFSCTHAQLFSCVEAQKYGIEVRVDYAVHPSELCELWEVTVQNASEKTRRIDLFACTLFDLGGYPMPFYYNAPTTSATEYVPESHAVLCASQNPYGGMTEKSGFIATTAELRGVCGNADDFTGLCGGFAAPRVLRERKHLSGSMATVRERCGILENSLTLPPSSRQTVYYVLGFTQNRQTLTAFTRNLFPRLPELFNAVRQNSKRAYGELGTLSPSEQINTVLNRWAQKQVEYCCIGKKAVRDNAQLAVALLHFAPENARRTVIECLEHQYSDGHAVLLWYPVVETKLYSDPAFWLTIAVIAYVRETGDTAFLQEQYAWLDGGKASVLEHITAGLRWYEDEKHYGKHGLPKIYHADWNDALNIPDENAETVFMGMCVCYLFGEAAELFDYLGYGERAKSLRAKKAALAEKINLAAWNGDYYVRAFSKFGTVGDKDCEGGAFYFNPQSWAILAGIVPPERLPRLLQAVDLRETPQGVPMCVPPYPHYDETVGRMSGMLAGVYENGGIYNHAGCFKVMADCALGRGDRAVQTLLSILPNGKANPSEHSELEPYVFANCYLKHPSVDGKVASSWQTGTSAWGLRCYYEGILGIRGDWLGLRISPCLPQSWHTVTAERPYRGHKVHITITRAGGNAVRIAVDGKEISGDTIPSAMLTDGGEHTVTVRLEKERA